MIQVQAREVCYLLSVAELLLQCAVLRDPNGGASSASPSPLHRGALLSTAFTTQRFCTVDRLVPKTMAKEAAERRERSAADPSRGRGTNALRTNAFLRSRRLVKEIWQSALDVSKKRRVSSFQ